MAPAAETERRELVHQLTVYLQLRKKPQDQIQKYTDKISSGKYDSWMRQLALALRDQTQDIFAGLDDSPKSGYEGPDVAALLRMEDENDRVASASSRNGQLRERPDAELVRRRLEDQAKQDAPTISKEQKHFVAINEAYPPSTTALQDLNIVKLAQLTQETHHRGSALVVERCAPLARDGVALLTAVKDDSGDVENVELNHVSHDFGEHVLHTDASFAIKEPYFTVRADGVPTIRIDHPTDIVPTKQRSTDDQQSASKQRTTTEWKEAGNDLLRQGRLWNAREAYRTGLAKASADEQRLKLDLARNLARVDLDLGRYDEALDSALRAISDGSDPALTALDVKAYYRAASASYQLRDYSKTEECLSKLLELDNNDADGKRDMQRVRNRLVEQKSGEYDFERIAGRLSAQNPRADIADYTIPVTVEESQVGGRGLFATCDLKLGDLVLVEKACCSVFEKDKSWFAAWEYNQGRLSMAASTMSLWDVAIQRLLKNPSTTHEFATLRGDYEGIGEARISVDDADIVDTFQIRSIIESNAFGIPTPSKNRRAKPFGFTAEHMEEKQLGDNTGLYLKVSMMNHSCVPNTRKIFLGDAIIIRATRPISKGEELFQSYAQTDAGVEERMEMLESTWHFRCNCKLCSAEAKESEKKRKNREMLEQKANQLGNGIKNASASAAEISKADVLLRSIKSSYDSQLYEGLPRKASIHLYIGLIHHYMRQNQRVRCMSTTTSLFDMLGWRLNIIGDAPDLSRNANSETHIVPELVDVVLMQKKSGAKNRQAEQLENMAKDLYLAVNGVPCAWERLLK